ncbi:MAG: hypothetical protein NUV81_03720 [bacterium]|nr:hypothetical protein [bacterium]
MKNPFERKQGSDDAIQESLESVEHGDVLEKRMGMYNMGFEGAEKWLLNYIMPMMDGTNLYDSHLLRYELYKNETWQNGFDRIDTEQAIRRDAFVNARERSIDEMREAVESYIHYVVKNIDAIIDLLSKEDEFQTLDDDAKWFLERIKSSKEVTFSEISIALSSMLPVFIQSFDSRERNPRASKKEAAMDLLHQFITNSSTVLGIIEEDENKKSVISKRDREVLASMEGNTYFLSEEQIKQIELLIMEFDKRNDSDILCALRATGRERDLSYIQELESQYDQELNNARFAVKIFQLNDSINHAQLITRASEKSEALDAIAHEKLIVELKKGY